MPRPRYENDDSLKDEREFADIVEAMYKMTLHKLNPLKFQVDFFYERANKKPSGWIEFKRRKHRHKQFPDVMLSATKWERGVQLANTFAPSPFLFFVRWDDMLGYIMYDPKDPWSPPILEWGGRTTNTRDKGDIEPVVKFPLKMWTLVDLPPEAI